MRFLTFGKIIRIGVNDDGSIAKCSVRKAQGFRNAGPLDKLDLEINTSLGLAGFIAIALLLTEAASAEPPPKPKTEFLDQVTPPSSEYCSVLPERA